MSVILRDAFGREYVEASDFRVYLTYSTDLIVDHAEYVAQCQWTDTHQDKSFSEVSRDLRSKDLWRWVRP